MINRYRLGLITARRYRLTGPQDWPLWADYEQTRQAKIHGAMPGDPVQPNPTPTATSSPHESQNLPPQLPPSGPNNAPPTRPVSTPISAAPPTALANDQGSAAPSTAGNFAGILTVQSPAPHLPLRQLVELWLKREGIPYVSVDEAKKALFAGAKLRSFHFVAYRHNGPHWLIWAGKITPDTRSEMLQWEQIFGDGFKAVLARPSRSNPLGFTTQTLADEPIHW